MIWLSWRQQRLETLITATILVLLAAGFIPVGIHLADEFTQQHLAHCVNHQTQACGFALGNFTLSAGFFGAIFDSGWLNLVPGLIGVALAAPLLLDLENGTTRLAWTQSVTRGRWLSSRLGLAVGTVLVAAVGFSVLFTWYQRPHDRIWGRWDHFDFAGIVPVGYTLFALGLALAIGVLLRRSAAALLVAFGLYIAARLFVQSWLRQRLVTPLVATWGPRAYGPNINYAWVITEGPSDKAGHFFSGSASVFQTCASAFGKGIGRALNERCMARHGAGYTHVVYQPASRFWEFQGIEFALFGGGAVLLIAFASWRVLRAD
jgi:hypothetical protein